MSAQKNGIQLHPFPWAGSCAQCITEVRSVVFFFLWVPHQFYILCLYDSLREPEDATGGTWSRNAIKLAILVRGLR